MSDLQTDIDRRLNWAKHNSTLCPAPYITMDVRRSQAVTQGVFKTCCCNLDDKLFVPTPGLDPFAEIKQQQFEGQWPAACHQCQWEESHGGVSERVRSFLEMPQDRLQQFILKRSIHEYELRIKFSNFCNLSCRSCSPYESSTYAKTTNSTVNEQFEVDVSDSDEHWQFITEHILEKVGRVPHFFVHFIGGETLVQPGMRKLLTWLIEQGLAPKVNLRLTTALTVNPSDELLNMLSQFNSVDMLLSIDGVGDNYSYIRWPARFDKIKTNLDNLVAYKATLTVSKGRKIMKPLWKCAVSPVFSLNNIMYIDDWLEYWCSWYEQKGFVFHTFVAHLVPQTVHLDLQALPVRYRSQLIELLTNCKSHRIFSQYPDQMRGVYNFLNSSIDELNTLPDDQELWQRFLKHTAYFDQKTKMKFAIFNKRLYSLLNDYDQAQFESMCNNIDTQSNITQAMKFIPNVQS